jgi:hypothetical protein
MSDAAASIFDVAAGDAPVVPEDIAAALESIALATGDRRYARAARALFRRDGSGRRPCDDDKLIAEARWLIETSQASTAEEASKLIAASHPGHSFEAVQRRIARKLRAVLNARAENI